MECQVRSLTYRRNNSARNPLMRVQIFMRWAPCCTKWLLVEERFLENYSPRVIDAILHQMPVPPHTLNPGLSGELERIIMNCLAGPCPGGPPLAICRSKFRAIQSSKNSPETCWLSQVSPTRSFFRSVVSRYPANKRDFCVNQEESGRPKIKEVGTPDPSPQVMGNS